MIMIRSRKFPLVASITAVLVVNRFFFDTPSLNSVDATTRRSRRESESSSPHAAAPRVAQCFVGQTRTLGHPLLPQNYRAHVSSRIGAEIDAYFVLDEPIATTNTTYDSFFPVPIVAADALATPTMQHQYLRWTRCLEMVEEREKEKNATTGTTIYSHVILSRVDMVVLQDFPRAEDFPVTSAWVRPYPENMEDYPPEYSKGDDGAETVGFTPGGVSDLVLVMSRPVAGRVLREMRSVLDAYDSVPDPASEPGLCDAIRCGGNATMGRVCGGCSFLVVAECMPKCALHRAEVPVVYQNFQVRILRDHRSHRNGGCSSFGTRDSGKHYNSMCI
mmetsp:Transcript_22640/g.47701  ORF Transcript_22640/g.47701 Transcript_22640/m.47701 type:complete len:332 (-) Transcript_22640:194-1189(-)|eukprot:CAMPEP_0183745344 /NCGR_PEP_ID=MMETSP0737-20130205/66192_1 /TAXON_ID=385413 /ORGANISM="Thalassiosira miniscula, Strain CCMP1093" /LENGTH=331 /DNA_ID=CAMNT_0025981005 /DNA_START=31 /DNA_END=1026 /DNA_ORIENTATION=-